MIKEFSKNFIKNDIKDRVKSLIFNVVLFTSIYVIFEPIWWQMLIVVTVYIAVRVAWSITFKRFAYIFKLYSTTKDVYQAIPDESKMKLKFGFKAKRRALKASIREKLK